MTLLYTPRSGIVWIRSFDEGVIKSLGGVVRTSGDGKNNFYVPITPGSCMTPGTSLDLPVIFGNPDPLFEKKTYPAFVVTRGSVTPALERWHSQGAMQEFYGVLGTEVVVDGKTRYNQVEQSPQAWPYDITYTIAVYSKYEYEAQTLLRHMMMKFPPRCHVSIVDSLGDVRTYDAFVDSDISDLSEIVDISDRVKSYSLSLKVEAEIDLVAPIVNNTVQTVEISSDLL